MANVDARLRQLVTEYHAIDKSIVIQMMEEYQVFHETCSDDVKEKAYKRFRYGFANPVLSKVFFNSVQPMKWVHTMYLKIDDIDVQAPEVWERIASTLIEKGECDCFEKLLERGARLFERAVVPIVWSLLEKVAAAVLTQHVKNCGTDPDFTGRGIGRPWWREVKQEIVYCLRYNRNNDWSLR